MSDENSNAHRARRGYGIMAALFLAAVLVFNVDAVVDLTRDRMDLVAILPRAEGVRVGSVVWVAGVESGRVTRIGFRAARTVRGTLDSAAVAVHVRLAGDAGKVITRNSDARAVRLRFIGQPVLQIDAGHPGDPPIRDGDTIYARPRADPMELLEQGRALPGALDSLFRAMRAVHGLADDRAPALERLVDQLAAVTEIAAPLSAELEHGSLTRLLDDEDGLPARLGELQERVRQLQDASALVLRRYAGPEGSDGTPPGLGPAVQGLLRRAETLDGELTALRTRLAGSHGFLVRIQQDSALQVAVRGVQAQMDSLTAEAVSIGLRMLLP